MKKLLFFLGAMFISCNAMTVYWDGESGKVIRQEIYNISRVNLSRATDLFHISLIRSIGATGIKLIQQPCRATNGIGELEVWWY